MDIVNSKQIQCLDATFICMPSKYLFDRNKGILAFDMVSKMNKILYSNVPTFGIKMLNIKPYSDTASITLINSQFTA